MSDYLIIESHDPFETREERCAYGLAADLARAGHAVTLFLVQNGVLPARRGVRCDSLGAAVDAGVQVLADEFSLRERAISSDDLAPGVLKAPVGAVIDQMEEGRKTLWH
jgi:sulfur relay (sulfurtransferase) complex TusBCD TusD component (DsrE family)